MIRVTPSTDWPRPVVGLPDGPAYTPEEQAAADDQERRFWANGRTLSEHFADFLATHPGEYVAVAGGEAFFDPTVRGALEKARAAHPAEYGVVRVWHIRSTGGR